MVLSRLGPPPDIRYFTPEQEAVATCLLVQLLDQSDEPDERRIPVTAMIDARLAEGESDGWHYADMPPDGDAWCQTLSHLDADAAKQFGRGFASCSLDEQARLVQAVQDLGSDAWHGLPAAQVWSLWTRYACTAFYSHPWAWDEIGFSGPAYPRGYKNAGVGKREPFEVRDQQPDLDPLRRGE